MIGIQIPRRDRLPLRLTRLVFGLVLCGLGIAFMKASALGLGPWDVLHEGVSVRTGIRFGTVGIWTGVVVLLGWIPLRERIGIGTALNVVLIGVTINEVLRFLTTPEELWLRAVFLALGPLLFGVGSGYYIGAGLGPGPRDGLMTGLAKRGLPIHGVRTGIEVSALTIGFLLGGTVGLGTLVFALTIGPIVHVVLPRLTMDDHTAPAEPARASAR